MPEAATGRLLDLPWELRRPIIVHVLQRRRSKLPSFSRKLIESRLRLRNCLDANFPEVTNFYVPRHKNRYLHGNGLRATNRQLRHETDQLIQEELKSGSIDVPFVLDVMVVKDIGVFPSWMSFPYRPEHLKKLTVNLRIVRPGTSTVPNEWVEVARYKDDKYYPTSWHLLMAITLYAFGCFSVKQDPVLPRVQRNSQAAATEEAQPAKTKQANDNKTKDKQLSLRPKGKESNSGMRPNLVDHQSDTFDAFRLSSASYVTDELLIKFDEFEYDANSKPIPPPVRAGSKGIRPWDPILPGALETCKESRFYKEGCVQFGRDLFSDYSSKWKDGDEIVEDLELVYKGKYRSYQLQDVLTETIFGVRSPEVHESTLAPYFQVLAHSVGVINHAGPMMLQSALLERYPSDWTYYDDRWEDDAHDDEWDYSDHIIERNLARELARDPPDEGHILRLRILQSRKAHGWILESDC
jgi:hypothetical protein